MLGDVARGEGRAALNGSFPALHQCDRGARQADCVAAKDIGDQIDALICLLDDLGGDPDLEDGGDDEPSGGEADASFPEWHPGWPNGRGMAEPLQLDDAEEDDHSGVGAEDDFERPHYLTPVSGPGCAVSDTPEYSENDADVDDHPIVNLDAYVFHQNRIATTAQTRGDRERPSIE